MFCHCEERSCTGGDVRAQSLILIKLVIKLSSGLLRHVHSS